MNQGVKLEILQPFAYSTYEEGMINTVVFYFDTKTRLRMTSLRNEKVYNSEEKAKIMYYNSACVNRRLPIR